MPFRGLLTLIRDALLAWHADNAPRMGAALAFYTVLSLAPLLIVAVSIAGLFLNQADLQAAVVSQVQSAVGDSGAQVVRTLFDNAYQAYSTSGGIWALIVGTVILLFGSSVVVGELKQSVDNIWHVQPKRLRLVSFLRERLISLAMVLGIGFLLVVSTLLSTLLNTLSRFLSERLAVPLFLMGALDVLISLLGVSLLFALLYKTLPDTRVKWRDVWLGAVLAAIAFTAGKWLIGLYLAHSALSSAYGAAGSLVILLLWIFISAQIFFFGAEVTHQSSERRKASS